eukprot:scaffold84571_cov59-Phaeocystis_antarctica.AAC.3
MNTAAELAMCRFTAAMAPCSPSRCPPRQPPQASLSDRALSVKLRRKPDASANLEKADSAWSEDVCKRTRISPVAVASRDGRCAVSVALELDTLLLRLPDEEGQEVARREPVSRPNAIADSADPRAGPAKEETQGGWVGAALVGSIHVVKKPLRCDADDGVLLIEIPSAQIERPGLWRQLVVAWCKTAGPRIIEALKGPWWLPAPTRRAHIRLADLDQHSILAHRQE